MRSDLNIAEIKRAAEWFISEYGDDADFLRDFLEGETDLFRIIGRIHEQIARDQEMLVGIKERKANLKERETRISSRVDASKAMIGKFLRAANLTKFEMPEVTYSVRDGKPGLVVVDPSAVPPEYQRNKPEPDKAAINEAFAQTEALPNWLVREPARDVVTARTK